MFQNEYSIETGKIDNLGKMIENMMIKVKMKKTMRTSPYWAYRQLTVLKPFKTTLNKKLFER